MMDVCYLNDCIEAEQEKLFRYLSKLIQINSENYGDHKIR